MDGFSTAGQPLLLWQKDSGHEEDTLKAPWGQARGSMLTLPPHCLSYIKGRGRTATVLTILSMVIDDGIDLALVHEKLFHSLRVVWINVIRCDNFRHQALLNISLSQKGSIRKSYNCNTWCKTLRSLQQRGDTDAAETIRIHNNGVSKQFQLVGAKAQSVKCVFDLMTPEVWDIFDQIVSVTGWLKSPFTDEGLGIKRIYPGAITRCSCKTWTARLRTTAESMKLMFLHIGKTVETLGERSCSKLSKAHMTELAEMAAYVYNIGKELQKTAPITDQQLWDNWCSKFVEDDCSVIMEVQMFLSSKPPEHSPRDVKTLAMLMDTQSARAPVQPLAAELSLQGIEEDAFAHLQKQMDYDVEAVRVYQHKVKQHANSVYNKRLEWRKAADQASRRAADWFIARHTSVILGESESDIMEEKRKFKRSIMENLQIEAADIITVPLLNWVNPAAIKSSFMSKMATQAQEALSESDKNIGLCLTPEFVYQKGTLWLQEMQCAKMLSKQRMHVDRTMNVNTMKCTHACV